MLSYSYKHDEKKNHHNDHRFSNFHKFMEMIYQTRIRYYEEKWIALTSTSVIYQIGEINLDNQAPIQTSVQATVLAKFSRSPQPYKSMYEDIRVLQDPKLEIKALGH